MGLTFEVSTAYGWIGIGLVLTVGLVLVLFRPYWAFLFAIFVLTATSINVGIMRTEELGAYFNVSDACTLVIILACLWEKKRTLLLPAPTVILSAVLTMGFLNSLANLGLTYGVLRTMRWCITVPLLIFLAANLVQDQRKVRSLLLTLVLAAVVAEIQHLFTAFAASGLLEENLEAARTSQFIYSGSDLWLLAGFYVVGGVIPHRRVQTAIGALFLAGFLTMQTRSMGLALMATWMVYYLWFLKGPQAFRWQRFKSLLPIVIVGVNILAILGLSAVISGYGERLVTTVEKGEGTQSRWNDLYVETNAWLDGNPIIGRGLNYFESRQFGKGSISKTGIGYGHLGYITYLAQLGLIGFLAYGIWFPLAVVLRSRRLLQQPQAPPEVVHLAALTGAAFIYYPLMFLFSSSFLTVTYVPPILVGGVWGITAFQFEPGEVPALETPSPPQTLPKSIIAEPYHEADGGRPLL
jgi:hypothetical protein